MRPTFMGLETAKRGLMVNQKAIDIVGNNITNMQTKGYTRQRLDTVSVQVYGGMGGFQTSSIPLAGQGVDMLGVAQIRNPYLDSKFREQYGEVGYYDQRTAIMQELEGIISDPETEGTGLKDALTILSQALADFGEQPYQETNANITLNAVKGITHILNEYDSKLKNAMQEQKDDLAASVKDINGKLKQLAELNKSIVHEVFVSDDLDGVSYGPNDLLDQRNVILDDLSRYGNVSVTEGGDGRIQVKFNGKTVVDSSGNQFTSDELLIGPDGVTLTWNSDNSGMHLENGALKAYTDVITGNAPGNAGIPYYQQKLDDFAAAFGELMNNTIHEDDGTAVFKTLIEAEGGGALTAGNISVSTAWAEDPSYVIRDQNPDGTLDNTDIMKLKAGLSEERTFGKEYKSSGNFSGFITNYTDTLGSDIKTTKARLNASLAIAESVEKDRQGVSGVSLNEEGINLMTYNKAYQALGRLMTTMDEQLDMIINQMGMVGR